MNAALYRRAVRELFTPGASLTPPATDPELCTFFATHFRDSISEWQRLEAERAEPNRLSSARSGVFVFAVGHFACGGLEAAPHILPTRPASGGVRLLAGVLTALLPVPADMRSLTNTHAFQAWLLAAMPRLRWDAPTECYLED